MSAAAKNATAKPSREMRRMTVLRAQFTRETFSENRHNSVEEHAPDKLPERRSVDVTRQLSTRHFCFDHCDRGRESDRFASPNGPFVSSGATAQVLEPFDAGGNPIGRLVIAPQLSREVPAPFTVEKNGRLFGSGEIRIAPERNAIEVTISCAGTNQQVHFSLARKGSAIESSIAFDGLKAAIEADGAALRKFADEAKQIAADEQAGRRKMTVTEKIAKPREVLRIRGELKLIRARLAESALQRVIDEVASILAASNDAERTPALFALRTASRFLAPTIFLDRAKADLAAKDSSPALPRQHLAQITTNGFHQKDTQDCDYGAQLNCDLVWLFEIGICYDITWHCINECWFVSFCDTYSYAAHENFEACMWLGDSCALAAIIELYFCLIPACEGCPDCCQINC